ncbi:MAG: hypothetical protein JNM17_01115 [Archangium sp.]|nr:hypothetical protein [Archangium sp.]
MRFELPEKIECREDALRLWLHLVGLDVRFDAECDPADYRVYGSGKRFNAREVRRLRALVAQAHQCEDQRVVRDAFRLSRLARTIGPNLADHFDLEDIPRSYEKVRRLRQRINDHDIVDWRV